MLSAFFVGLSMLAHNRVVLVIAGVDEVAHLEIVVIVVLARVHFLIFWWAGARIPDVGAAAHLAGRV